MADITINIRKSDPVNPSNTTTIAVTGSVDDGTIAPIIVRLTSLLASSAAASA